MVMSGVVTVITLHPHLQLVVRQALAVHAAHARVLAGQDDEVTRRVTSARRIAVAHVTLLLAGLLPGKPGITVITPTWQRQDLLISRCVPSVLAQGYDGEVRHIIISDGPDAFLPPLPGLVMLTEHVPERNRGLRARRFGASLAQTELVAYLDDDNSWRPAHLATLAQALASTGAGFAYSRAQCHDNGYSYVIGASPPAYAQVDTSLIVHRRELLDLAGWQPSDGPADWDLVSRWVRAGVKWVAVPDVTMDYYAREAVK